MKVLSKEYFSRRNYKVLKDITKSTVINQIVVLSYQINLKMLYNQPSKQEKYFKTVNNLPNEVIPPVVRISISRDKYFKFMNNK